MDIAAFTTAFALLCITFHFLERNRPFDEAIKQRSRCGHFYVRRCIGSECRQTIKSRTILITQIKSGFGHSTRLFERRAYDCFDGPIAIVMTKTPLTIHHAARMEQAVALMRAHKISELPVIGDEGQPVGLLDVTDLIGAESAAEPAIKEPAVRAFSRVSA